MNNQNEIYCLGLMAEEMAEVTQLIGKALRFGLDAPGPEKAPYFGRTSREMLHEEIGDVLASISFSIGHGMFDQNKIEDRGVEKLERLQDPEAKCTAGNRLAPAVPGEEE